MSTQIPLRVVSALLLASSLSLSACTAPDLGAKPQMRTPALLASGQSIAGSVSAHWPSMQWWRVYGDPALDALVDEAIAGSPSVAMAQARIRQARGAAQAAGADLLPGIAGEGSAGWTKQSYNMGIPRDFVPKGWNSTGTLALSGDFDLDLWGKNRKALAAATSEADAAMADARQAELLIASNVASSYFDLARLIARGEALQAASDARAAMARLSAQRAAEGLDNEVPARQAEALAASARAAVSANAEQVLLRRHALAALLGAGPDRGLTITPAAMETLAETAVPADAGIALAARRPDIVAARLRAEAAASRIEVARLSYLPDISLQGLLGLNALGISNLIESDSTYGNAGAAIGLPVFQGGRLAGNFRSARGAYDAAVADYNETVVSALRDVADALASRRAADEQARESAEARRTAERAYVLAEERYRGGLSNYLEALSAQTTALEAREAAIDARFRTLALDVALQRALGGGFEDQTQDMTGRKATDDE